MGNQLTIGIIGAGVSGLIAARHLEEAGKYVEILEADDAPGGRVQTDRESGYLFDRGFQVLLTAYKEVERYLDTDALMLERFRQGAVIYKGGRRFRIADPLRDISQLLPMIFSPVGSISDKIKMWQLANELKKAESSSLFVRQDIPTLEYLEDYGFSEQVIERFFRPFFGGIFLENELRTASGMFRFVFKMFSEGDAAIPRKGMGEIGKQLAGRLVKTRFHYGSRVASIEGTQIIMENGERRAFDKLIIATDPHPLVPALQGQHIVYTGTSNLYFSAKRGPLQERIIGLVADADNPINNFCELTAVSADYAPAGRVLVSVTLKEGPPVSDIVNETRQALAKLTGMKVEDFEFLKMYQIPHSLPALEDLRYDLPATQTKLTDEIYLAGDYLLNASLDASMRSGRRAAEAVLNSL